MTTPLLQIRQLSVAFKARNQETLAVNGINLVIHPGETFALVGESGSGKSVTSLSILGLLPEAAIIKTGEINLTHQGQTTDLLKLPAQALRKIRGHRVSMIFQEPMTSLNPVMRCGDQVSESLQLHLGLGAAAARQQAIAWFEKVRLPAPGKTYNRYPHELSGGQKQRVMIALAMCCNPRLLICDEPTTALDVTVQKTILELIKSLQAETGMSVLFITHDLGVVAEMAHRVGIMYQGQLVEEGATTTLLKNPAHPYTKALIACRPALHAPGERLPTVADMESGISIEKAAPSKKTVQEQQVLVAVKDLVVSFPVRRNWLGKVTQEYHAVNGVSLEIRKGETLGLVGESGCGKTTLGRSILHLIKPSSGTIFFNGERIEHVDSGRIRALRKASQLVFQDPYSSLNPRMTVGSAIEEVLALHFGMPGKHRRDRVADLLKKVDLPPDAARRYPHEFSGGQRQRIVIARALAVEPAFLVCDESVSALDVSVQAQVLNLLNDLKGSLGLTLLFISHDLSVVRYMCNRILVMHAGEIVEAGDAEQIYTQPRHPYTARLLEAVPRM